MVTNLKELSQKDLENNRVMVRVDFNVPLNGSIITDDTRIQAALPTINYLIENKAKVILVSHLGRPKGKVVEELRLDPIAKRLAELVKTKVIKINESVGEVAKKASLELKAGEILLLENIRFNPGEETNDVALAKELSELATIFVNDAFGAAHRAHASTEGVTNYTQRAVAGFLMSKELEMLGAKLANPERPFTAIIGGSKISSKITVLKNLVKKVDTLIIGGGMAFTFLKAQGGQIGKSLCENDQLDTAREIINLADDFDTALILPEDTKATKENIFSGKLKETDEIRYETFKSKSIPDDYEGLDAGEKTEKQFAELISQSRTVIWNGPVGVFEFDSFASGTKTCAIALQELTKKGGVTIIGGGDSVAALEKFHIPKEAYTHVSTGGGASLEFLEGKTLPGVACLENYNEADYQSAQSDKASTDFSEEMQRAGA
jgi:phosphoglycerate kinase